MKNLLIKILNILIVPTLIGAIIYLIGAFVALNLNPIYWAVEGRMLIAILEIIGLACGIALALFSDNKNN